MDPKKNSVNDLTKGPVARQILLFALPFLGSSLIQQLYNTVDLIFVGNVLGTEASAAVGAGSLLITCLLGFFTGISVGVGVVAAKAFGGGDRRALRDIVHTAAGISVLGSLLLIAVGVAFAPAFLRWLNTPEDILPLAVVYMRIYFAGLFSIVTYNVSSGILRALGNSRDPMRYQLIGGITNVVCDALFLIALKQGVAGAAMATFFSQGVSALLTARKLCRLDDGYRLRLRQIRIDRKWCARILAVGIPSAVQAMVITLSNLIVQSRINSLGITSIAAFTAYYKVENFIYLPIMAIGQANAAFAGQNYGAGREDRVRGGVKTSLLVGIPAALAISALLIGGSNVFFGFFSKDPDVIRLGGKLAATAFPLYFLYVIMEVLSGTIRGSGRALPPMVITLANMCGVRLIALGLLMRRYGSAEGVARVYPITWITSVVCLLGYLGVRRLRAKKLSR